MNPIDRSSIIIAKKPLRFAQRSYEAGDRFDYQRLGYAQRRRIKRLIEGHDPKLVELTQGTMASALKYREKGSRPPKGFTLNQLLGLGVLSQEQIDEMGWGEHPTADKPVESWTAPEGSWQVNLEGDDTVEALWIVPFKTGGAPRYFVHDATGANLNGAASISGKGNAEDWARDHLTKQVDLRKIARDPDQLFKDFPQEIDEWTDDQVEAFNVWFEELEEGSETKVSHPAVVTLFEERMEARRAEAAKTEHNEKFAQMSEAEARDFFESMSDDDLRALVAAAQSKDPAEVQMERLGLLNAAADIHALSRKQPDDSDLPAESQPND